MSWGTESENPVALAKNFARFRKSSEDVAAKLSFPKRVEPVSGVGDEAFQEISEHDISIRVIKDDLFFSLTLDTYSPQSEPNAVALAAQAANRWRGGVGMVEPASPIKPNTTVDIPPDTRVSKTPPVDRWPDACALLTLEDVYSVFGDMNVSQPRKTMGKVTHFSRVDRVEEIPNPIGCSYDAHKTEVVDGKREVISNSIGVRVVDVSLTPEAAKKSFGITQKGRRDRHAPPGPRRRSQSEHHERNLHAQRRHYRLGSRGWRPARQGPACGRQEARPRTRQDGLGQAALIIGFCVRPAQIVARRTHRR